MKVQAAALLSVLAISALAFSSLAFPAPGLAQYGDRIDAMMKHKDTQKRWLSREYAERRSRDKRMSPPQKKRPDRSPEAIQRAANYSAHQSFRVIVGRVEKAGKLEDLYGVTVRATRDRWSKMGAGDKQKTLAAMKNWAAKVKILSVSVETTTMVATVKVDAPGITGVHLWSEDGVFKFSDTFRY
ncbi:MAG: hypothetical protein IPM23_00530 [Candidatus Melainabacteria bacterium]|nr:hypothetical protein [Candidatus Melainabacteria bacterium]